ncbi:MAG: endoribonuclease MazF [Actinobacteria bacterium]|nr:endoribonuclease MazF [Actinomycetota bacterium]
MSYIPDRGDIIWLEFDSQKGHEQKGRRPGIVLSKKEYNQKSNLAIICPITSKIKDYPFEVRINSIIEGVILSDQIRSLDWKSRNAAFIEKTSEEILKEILENIDLLLNE